MFNNLLEVPTTAPDDARRRKLLNIILFGIAGIALWAFVTITILEFTNTADDVGFTQQEGLLFFAIAIGLLVQTVVFYFLNRKLPSTITGTLFLIFLLLILSVSDEYQYLANGRSTLVFTLPIVMASMLVGPRYSFLFAILASIDIAILAKLGDTNPNIAAMWGFLMLALVSWLSSRSMEQALRDLRALNLELDKRVEERTRELAAALSRELAEAGKNQAILDGIADGVMVFDPDGYAIVANPALGSLLSISPRALVGQTMDEFVESSLISDKDRETIRLLLKNPDKSIPSARFGWGPHTISVNAAPVLSGLGQLLGTVAVFRDFTREAEIEQMKNTFVAMVSHELRTPLNAIMAYAEMLQEGVYGAMNPKQSNAAGRIYTNSQRLLALVSDLLDQAQIEAGKLKLVYADFKPGDLLDALHGVMDKPAQDKGLKLTSRIDPALPAVLRGDSYRLQQVLINLVNNAVKFTKEGKIAVCLYRYNNERWALDVVDTGPGIPPEALPFIFDSFRQVDGVTTRQHGGVGLGLAIVKRLVELMGGEIKVSSIVDQGTTFNVILPIAPLPKEEPRNDNTVRIDH
jgi:signal transduction histidine kinase